MRLPAIILVEPQGEANMGAVARAIKNFGLADLRLVSPKKLPGREAYKWAVGARDILEGASIYEDLGQALDDISYAAALTCRIGRLRKRHMSIEEAAAKIMGLVRTGKTALVFGREDDGLTNAEVRRCDALVSIPTVPGFPSLNLAQAVLIATYEVKRHLPAKNIRKNRPPAEQFLPRKKLAPILSRIDQALCDLGYEDIDGNCLRTKILRRIEKIFGRAGLTESDVRMIEGLVGRIGRYIKY